MSGPKHAFRSTHTPAHTQSLRKAEQQLESTHAELIPLFLIQSRSSAHGSSFPRCTAFSWYHLLSSDQKHHVVLPGWRGRALQFSQRWMKVWTFGWRRIRELGSNFRRRKSSSVSSCPPPKADVRAHPSVVNFGSVSSSSLYLPACRCLRRREDAIWDALPRRLSSSHFQDLHVLRETMSKTCFVIQVQPVYDLKKHYCLCHLWKGKNYRRWGGFLKPGRDSCWGSELDLVWLTGCNMWTRQYQSIHRCAPWKSLSVCVTCRAHI